MPAMKILEMSRSRSMDKFLPSIIIVGGGLILFLIWSLWTELPEIQNSCADGFVPCPPESYKVLNVDGKLCCKSCPKCAGGEELIPPCGSTIYTEGSIVCQQCQPGFFSEFGIGECKPCDYCGLKRTIRSCSAKQNTLCRDCPAAHYEDNATGACKHCSSCCRNKPSAYSTCFITKQCRTNNCESTSAEKQQNIEGMSWKHRLEKVKPASAKSESSTVSKRDTSFSKANLMQASEDRRQTFELNVNDFFDYIHRSENTDHEKQKHNAFKILASDTKQAATDAKQATTDASQTVTNAKLMDEQNSERPVTTQRSEVITKTPLHEETSAPEHPIIAAATDQIGAGKESQTWFILPGFFEKVAAVLLALLIFFGIRYLLSKMRCKLPRLRGYLPLISTQDDIMLDYPVITATRTQPDLNLSELPLDVEDAVVIELDVPLETIQDKNSNRATASAGQYKYRWQKVGHEFGIPKNELIYLELEYKKENGSPTKTLLDKLGTLGKTVHDLINVLKRPNVNLLHVVSQL